MKKKGFTLIELLAVIVVLAIIALIATPIVMNVISNASKGAAERSADNYVKAVETLIATKRLDGEPVEDGTYTIGTDGNLSFGDVELNGTKPNGGSIEIKDGQVVKNESSIQVGNYVVLYDEGVATAAPMVILCTAIAPNTQTIYDEATKQMISTTVGVQATPSDKYALGAVYSCDLGSGAEAFYVLKDAGDKVKLIMNKNVAEGTSLDAIKSNWGKLSSAKGTVERPKIQDLRDAGVKTGDYKYRTPDWMRTNIEDNSFYGVDDYVEGDDQMKYTIDYNGGVSSMYYETADYYIRPVITISKTNMSL